MPTILSVGDVARQLDVRPSQITQLFSERRLSDKHCPVVAGRRLISPDYVPIIAMELRRKGIAVAAPEETATQSSPAARATRTAVQGGMLL